MEGALGTRLEGILGKTGAFIPRSQKLPHMSMITPKLGRARVILLIGSAHFDVSSPTLPRALGLLWMFTGLRISRTCSPGTLGSHLGFEVPFEVYTDLNLLDGPRILPEAPRRRVRSLGHSIT